MTYNVYALRDNAAGAFLAPTLNSNDAAAKRELSMAVNDKSGALSFKPSDFDLYQIGTYSTDDGVIAPVSPVRMVCNASTLVIDNG